MKQVPESSLTIKQPSNSTEFACPAQLANSPSLGNGVMNSSPASSIQLVTPVDHFWGGSPAVVNVTTETESTSQILDEVKKIEDFVSQHLVQFERYHETSSVKLKRLFLKTLSIAVGAGVGYSWLAPARASCESSVWGDITGFSMLFSYGIASTWTCFELVDYFFTKFPSEYRLNSAVVQERSNFLEHMVCHFLGLLSTIPVAYVTYTYNKKIPITLLDSIVAYAYNTFGLYQLYRRVLVPLYKTYRNANNQLLNERTQYITEVTEHIPEYFSEALLPAYKSFEMQIRLGVNDFDDKHNFFIQNVSNNISNIQNYEKNIILPGQWYNGMPKKGFQYLTTGLVASTNAIVLGVLTNNALHSVFEVENVAEKSLVYIAIALVMAATVGLLISTQEIILSKTFDELYYLLISNKNSVLNITTFVYVSLFMVSVASGHTAYYVSKTQLEGTVLNDYTIFFAAMMWAGETFFEGVGLISIAKQASIAFMGSLSKIRHQLPVCMECLDQPIKLAKNVLELTEYQSYLKDYGMMLTNCGNETYNSYSNKHQLKQKVLGGSSNAMAGQRFFSPSPVVDSVNPDMEDNGIRNVACKN